MGWKFPGYLVRGESWLTEGGRKSENYVFIVNIKKQKQYKNWQYISLMYYTTNIWIIFHMPLTSFSHT